MKLPRPVSVDMRDVLRTGRFDCLRVGQTKELILNNFPHPDDWSSEHSATIERSAIWRYGNVELHFEGPHLAMIFSDYLWVLDGGPSLAIEPWFLRAPDGTTLLAVMRALNQEHIDFEKATRAIGDVSHVALALKSGVTLRFEPEALLDPNELRLGAFEARPP